MYEDFSKSFYNTNNTDIPAAPQGIGVGYALQVANDNLRKAIEDIQNKDDK